MAPDFILLTKQDRWSEDAATVAKTAFGDRMTHWAGKVGSEWPEILNWIESGTTLLSFLSPWIVPAHVLERCSLALNFHPGSTSFPGIGCYNFALYLGATEYGAVCHRMLPKVDTGSIVQERLFPALRDDTVETLKLRTMIVMLDMFHDIVLRLAKRQALPRSDAKWRRKPYTRAQLNDLATLRLDMDEQELRRRIRATTYPGYEPKMALNFSDIVLPAEAVKTG